MAWQRMTVGAWEDLVGQESEKLENRLVAEVLDRFSLVPDGFPMGEISAGFHDGSMSIDDDFTPPTQLFAVRGDLTVNGKLSTEAVDGADGHASLVVFGNLRCARLVNDWASIILASGNCCVDDWAFAARDDSAFVIGGDFSAPIFIGSDIWASVGGKAAMDYGYGYAIDLASFDDPHGVKQIPPAKGRRELALRLGLGRQAVRDEADLLEALEQRLHNTGTILPHA